MKILAFETATDVCTVALWINGEVQERMESGNRHSEWLLEMVDALLADAQLSVGQLTALAFGRGPGSFTGLRIGCGVVQGLAYGADLPVAPVSSLAALAQGVDGDRVLAAIDARMHQVYWAACERNDSGLATVRGPEQVLDPQTVPLPVGSGWIGAGTGWDVYADDLENRCGSALRGRLSGAYPLAASVARLAVSALQVGAVVPAEQALPVYIRDEVAHRPGRSLP